MARKSERHKGEDMKQLLLAGGALVALAASQPVQAAYIVDLTQEGADVVASGTGTIDTAGLGFFQGSVPEPTALVPREGVIAIGPLGFTSVDMYVGFTGPDSFGSGALTLPSSGSGDFVGNDGFHILVPSGYLSGSALSDTSTYDNQTFSSLGVTPGSYVWTWGSGPTADSFTLQIETIPEPASLTLLGVALGGLGVVRRRTQKLRMARFSLPR
jgi:hypothetical protein